MTGPFCDAGEISPASLRGSAECSGALQVHGAGAAATVIFQIVVDALVAIECAHAGGFHGADVHKSVAAAVLGLDEAIALVGVEELDGSSDHDGFLIWRSRQSAPPMLREAREGNRSRKAPKTDVCD